MNKTIKLILNISLLTYIIKKAGIQLTLILLDNNYQIVAIIWSWIVGYYVVNKLVDIIDTILNEIKGNWIMQKTNVLKEFIKLFKLNWKVIMLYWLTGLALYGVTLIPANMLKQGIILLLWFGTILPFIVLVYLAIDQTRYLNTLYKESKNESNTK